MSSEFAQLCSYPVKTVEVVQLEMKIKINELISLLEQIQTEREWEKGVGSSSSFESGGLVGDLTPSLSNLAKVRTVKQIIDSLAQELKKKSQRYLMLDPEFPEGEEQEEQKTVDVVSLLSVLELQVVALLEPTKVDDEVGRILQGISVDQTEHRNSTVLLERLEMVADVLLKMGCKTEAEKVLKTAIEIAVSSSVEDPSRWIKVSMLYQVLLDRCLKDAEKQKRALCDLFSAIPLAQPFFPARYIHWFCVWVFHSFLLVTRLFD